MSQSYFQVGGFRPDVQWTRGHESRELASFLMEDSSPLYPPNRQDSRLSSQSRSEAYIELILGITKTGTAHLLLTDAQVASLVKRRRLHYRPEASRKPFESLSPIQFRTVDDLTKKLEQLRPKKTKHRDRDTSSTNGPYDENMEILARSSYEHGRVLYRFLNGMLSFSPETYGLRAMSWSKTLQVCSFVYNAWEGDGRVLDERRRSPIVLDYGYSSAHLPSFEPARLSTVHIKNKNNKSLRQTKNDQLEFSSSPSLELSSDGIRAHLQARFNHKMDDGVQPMILLVFKEKETISCLNYNGVDTSNWRSGLRELIMGERAARPTSSSYGQSARSQAKRRSVSPNSRQQHQQSTSFHSRSNSRSSRDYGPSGAPSGRLYAPVYVLDIQDLYRQLTNCPEALGTLGIARRFLDPPPPNGWCAGNEACLIIDIWRKMISGMSVDEQRELEGRISKPTGAQIKEEDMKDDNELDPDEVDPNEVDHVVPSSSAASKMTSGPEEDSDEGDSDDVSD